MYDPELDDEPTEGYPDEPPEWDRGPMHEASERDLHRWAERYEELNGAPENDEDR
jgi:hypothetical protein